MTLTWFLSGAILGAWVMTVVFMVVVSKMDRLTCPSENRCGKTIHSNYVSDHQCRRYRDHDGDCVFGRA